MMNRYWKPIVLLAVVLLTFGIYYVHGALAKEELLGLELVTITDKNNIEDNIRIQGGYDNGAMIWKNFELTNKGMENNEFNFLERLNGFYHNSSLEKQIKEHRGFMRGKEDVELFYEDEDRLVYVGPYSQGSDKISFNVDILDKTTNDKEKFSVKIPQEEAFEYMSTLEVQADGDKIYVFTWNYYRDGQQLHLYEIDTKERKITDSQTLESISDHGYISLLNDYNDISKKPYIVYQVEKVKWDEDTFEEERISLEFRSYNIESGEQQTITLPPEWNEIAETNNIEDIYFDIYSMDNYIVKGEFIYFIVNVENGIDIYPYHLGKNELEAMKHIPLELSDSENIISYFSEANHFSIIYPVEESSRNARKLFVIDPEKGELQYEGEIKITNAGKEVLVYYIEFYDVYID